MGAQETSSSKAKGVRAVAGKRLEGRRRQEGSGAAFWPMGVLPGQCWGQGAGHRRVAVG